MFEIQQNRSFSGFGAVVACTANQAAAEQLVGGTVAQPSGWLKLANEVQRYPTLSKTTQDAVRNGADATEKWYMDALTSSGWCARKEDLAAYQSLLERVAGTVAGEIASRGLTPVAVKGPGKAIVAPEERVTASAGWWGLTLGVLAVSAAAIIARRRRAGLGGVKSFRRRYGRGLSGFAAPSYKRYDPKGWGGDPKRGAAMGRPTVHEAPKDEPTKLALRRIRLDSGGYDPNGTYFGIGTPLYWYANDEGTVDAMLRASSRAEAKRKVLEKYPNASFYR